MYICVERVVNRVVRFAKRKENAFLMEMKGLFISMSILVRSEVSRQEHFLMSSVLVDRSRKSEVFPEDNPYIFSKWSSSLESSCGQLTVKYRGRALLGQAKVSRQFETNRL